MISRAAELLSLKETAVVANVPEALVRREIERKIVKASRAGGHVLFPTTALLYFALVARLFGKVDLSRSVRTELFRFLTSVSSRSSRSASPVSSRRSQVWERLGAEGDETLALHMGDADVTIETSKIQQEIEERLRLLRTKATRIHADPGIMSGVPVFKGTRIPVDSVRGQLARGVLVDDLLEHYPRLSRDDIALAEILNKLGRPPGRPKRTKPIEIRRV